METIILVPKNNGLRSYRDKALGMLQPNGNTLLEMRGEDIPMMVEKIIASGKNAIGLTGEDLFTEYCLKRGRSNLGILKSIEWNDRQAIFRKPALCLMGPQGKSLDGMPKNIRICIGSKYKNMAKRYLNGLEMQKGFNFKKFYTRGVVEAAFSEGVADLIIDIVYTGSSMERAGLMVFDRIFESDFVIIGGRDENLQIG